MRWFRPRGRSPRIRGLTAMIHTFQIFALICGMRLGSGDSRMPTSGGFGPRVGSPRIRGLMAMILRFQILLDFVGFC